MSAPRWPSNGRRHGTGATCQPQQMPISRFGITRTGRDGDDGPGTPDEETGGPHRLRRQTAQAAQPDRVAERDVDHLRDVLRSPDGVVPLLCGLWWLLDVQRPRKGSVPAVRGRKTRRLALVRRFLGRITWLSFIFLVAASCGTIITLAATGKLQGGN